MTVSGGSQTIKSKKNTQTDSKTETGKHLGIQRKGQT